MEKPTIKQTIEYEFKTNLTIFTKIRTWLNITACFFAFFALIKQWTAAMICVIILVILQIKLHQKTGEITAYFRKKNNIPTAGDIRRMKKKSKEQGKQK